ncbi:MAG TPA: glucose-1-phosphate cytidylyltransferase [Burkholderiales bacterium]|nr:glucose-1-phosphate cytidylyltransferase [Burkholderiales bacterium]
MKVAILAGGQGTRLAEETRVKSKAMVRIGEQPILWHLLKYYAHYGYTQFVIALGYHADSIREYFIEGLDAVPVGDGVRTVLQPAAEPRWTVELIDTGLETMSGGRLKRLAPYLGGAAFMLTWCDGLADVDLHRLRACHEAHGRLATLTAVHPPARFGRLTLAGDRISAFCEKTLDPDAWINGAFFVLEPGVFDYIEGDDTQFERQPLSRLAAAGELMAHRHEGFWQCMDTLKEAQDLNALWREGTAPWRIWP